MGRLDDETPLAALGPGRWRTELSSAWNIGDTANGGYAAAPVLRAMRSVEHPDPVSVTTHYLRPVRGDGSAEVIADLVRRGRTTSVWRGALRRDDRDLLTVAAVLGDLTVSANPDAPDFDLPPPSIPPPERCVSRAELAQGVALPILDRLDVRIHPEHVAPGGSPVAVIEGWIRLADGTPPDSAVLPLFADSFPPSLYPRLGAVGWVPTIELTVHVRRRPSDGWVQARLECDDLVGGRMIETGALWDSSGALVARSRQLGLLLQPG